MYPRAAAVLMWLASLSTMITLGRLGFKMLAMPSEPVFATLIPDGLCTLSYTATMASGSPRLLWRPSSCADLLTVPCYRLPGSEKGPDPPFRFVLYYSRRDPTVVALSATPDGAGSFWVGAALVSVSAVASVTLAVFALASALTSARPSKVADSAYVPSSSSAFVDDRDHRTMSMSIGRLLLSPSELVREDERLIVVVNPS